MKRNIISAKLRGTTIVELLVVMIVSGIVFLLLFDGLSIIHRYNGMLNTRLKEGSSLLYSHQTIETLILRSDSIRQNNYELLLFSSGVNFETLNIDSTAITVFSEEGYIDTLFKNYLSLQMHSIVNRPNLIDSLHITVLIDRDTVTLDYGISAYREQYSID